MYCLGRWWWLWSCYMRWSARPGAGPPTGRWRTAPSVLLRERDHTGERPRQLHRPRPGQKVHDRGEWQARGQVGRRARPWSSLPKPTPHSYIQKTSTSRPNKHLDPLNSDNLRLQTKFVSKYLFKHFPCLHRLWLKGKFDKFKVYIWAAHT